MGLPPQPEPQWPPWPLGPEWRMPPRPGGQVVGGQWHGDTFVPGEWRPGGEFVPAKAMPDRRAPCRGPGNCG